MRVSGKMLLRRTAAWAAVFAALLLFFHHFSPAQAEAPADAEIRLTVMTPDGPVETTMAEYLPLAVAAEMPVSFGLEALKAQAVAARSFVLYGTRHGGADVCTDSACCLACRTEDELRALWGDDYDECLAAVQAAAAATDGQVLTYQGQIIEAAFHASSAGCTESSAEVWTALPYLVSVPSPETEENTPGLVSDAVFSPEELAERLGLTSEDQPAAWLSGTERDDAGRVRYLRIAGQSLSGSFVRQALGLRSTDFTLRYDNGVFVFTAAGWGHGVGMSQEGAKLLAAEGWSYADILAHYYPGTELGTVG